MLHNFGRFTQWSTTIDAKTLVSLLNTLFSAWDVIAQNKGVEKIKTIGDCYMCACGCPEANEKHAEVIVQFAEVHMYIQ